MLTKLVYHHQPKPKSETKTPPPPPEPKSIQTTTTTNRNPDRNQTHRPNWIHTNRGVDCRFPRNPWCRNQTQSCWWRFLGRFLGSILSRWWVSGFDDENNEIYGFDEAGIAPLSSIMESHLYQLPIRLLHLRWIAISVSKKRKKKKNSCSSHEPLSV